MNNSRTRPNAVSLPVESTSKKVKRNQIKRQIDVFCRFRPIGKTETKCPFYEINPQLNTVELHAPDEVIRKNQNIKKYNFTKVFAENSSQEEIFEETVGKMVSSLLTSRINGLAFTYGVTNAGKTHTTIGSKEDSGILPRLLSMLMNMKCELNKGKSLEGTSLEIQPRDMTIYFECFEIYNEDIFDLNPDVKRGHQPKSSERPKLKLKENANGTVYVENLNKVEIKQEDEANDIIDRCLKNRQMASTTLNMNSSRSHTIFKVEVDLVFEKQGSSDSIVSQLGYISVVDLAGSERAKRTEAMEGKLKEAGGINNSLMVLGRCLQSIKKGAPVPFRDCRLTKFLAEFFKCDSNIMMITNINPRQEDFIESLRVLNYASIAKEITLIQSAFKTMRLEANRNRQSALLYPGGHEGMDCEGPIMDRGVQGREIFKTPVNGRQAMEVEGDRLTLLSQIQKCFDKFESALTEKVENMIQKAFDAFMQENLEIMRSVTGTKIDPDTFSKTRSEALKKIQSNKTSSYWKQKDQKRPDDYLKEAVGESKRKRSGKSSPPILLGEKLPRRKTGSRLRSQCQSDDEDHRNNRVTKSPVLRLVTKGCESPETKQKRSSFYTSLMKQPALTLKQAEELSKREHLIKMKEKYLFFLEVCGNDEEEAEKYFRGEFNQTPPKLTTKEKESLEIE